jgi:hypothetical protein
VRQGAPHGFRCRQRLLDIDFAPRARVFYVDPAYRVMYIAIVRTFLILLRGLGSRHVM